ncbi:RNA polymerase sigma factor [Dactylosporangium sp. NPDC049742]|uniref:RNA polymerase sigma factor n=1 Tax=Dactylosporangium sp. NPDC049742 TaxID=3154737 RepID=UPI00341C71F4
MTALAGTHPTPYSHGCPARSSTGGDARTPPRGDARTPARAEAKPPPGGDTGVPADGDARTSPRADASPSAGADTRTPAVDAGDAGTLARDDAGMTADGDIGTAQVELALGEVTLDDRLEVALAGAIGGDAAAFADLWRALQPLVLRYLRVVCGDAAEDVASETWLQASRDLRRFSGGTTAFRVWLFRIARNRGIDENRRAWRRREEPHQTVHEVREAAGEIVRDVALDAGDRSGTEWALRMIRTLPPDQAESVMLRVVAGLDVAGTAKVLGKRPGAVRVATMRGLRRLADHPEVQAHRGTDPREGG